MIRIGHARSEYTCPQCGLKELRSGRFVEVPENTRSFKGEEQRLPEVCNRCLGTMEWTPSTSMMVRDEIPGGIIVENYGAHPMRFDTHSERKAYLARNGLNEREKFAPFPGTDKDPAGIANPKGYVDQQTLENGRILMLRGAQGKDWDPAQAGVLGGQFSGHLTQRDAEAVAAGDTGRSSRLGRRIKDGGA